MMPTVDNRRYCGRINRTHLKNVKWFDLGVRLES